MAKRRRTTKASEILRRRYIAEDPERNASVEVERANADVAQTICELRKQAGLTQQELAEQVGTTQSVISRLEDADYAGHSLQMLNRIAKTLNRSLRVHMEPQDSKTEIVRYTFREVVRALRKSRGLSVGQLAKKTGVQKEDILAMERSSAYRPDPLTLHQLSKFYKVPHRSFAILAGAISDATPSIREEASKFAAKSESFSMLTREERQALDAFVAFLRSDDRGADEGAD